MRSPIFCYFFIFPSWEVGARYHVTRGGGSDGGSGGGCGGGGDDATGHVRSCASTTTRDEIPYENGDENTQSHTHIVKSLNN